MFLIVPLREQQLVDDLAKQERSIYFVWEFVVVKEGDIAAFFDEKGQVWGLIGEKLEL